LTGSGVGIDAFGIPEKKTIQSFTFDNFVLTLSIISVKLFCFVFGTAERVCKKNFEIS
jgi:hypothetical protein